MITVSLPDAISSPAVTPPLRVGSVGGTIGPETGRSVKSRRQTASQSAFSPHCTGEGDKASLAPEAAAILAALSGPVLLLDAQARWRAASPAAARLLELPPERKPSGQLPDWMHRSPELLAGLRERRPAELCLTTGRRQWRLKLTPLGVPAGITLLEIFDLSWEAALRGQVLSMYQAHDDLQAAHQELLCAYEVIEADRERERTARDAQARENQRLLQANLKLRRSLSRRRPN